MLCMLHTISRFKFLIISCVTCTVTLAACKFSSYSGPAEYQIANPERIELGKVMNEISGINFIPATGKILAISDSKEQVYQLDPQNLKITNYTGKLVASNSDLEDVVKVGASIYLLKSIGEIVEVPDNATDSFKLNYYRLPITGRNDFETLYYDSTANGLIMICKACESEIGKSVRTAYRFDLTSKTFDSTSFFTISKDEVKAILKTTEAKVNPSAAAIHPINGNLYVLSSAGNLMIITDTRGKVLDAYNIHPDDFPQAEGITFAPNGDMFISNEAKHGTPTLLKFLYQSPKKK